MYWARGYKTFFILNSADHEILNTHKYTNIKKFSLFSDSDKPRMLIVLQIKVKMPFKHLWAGKISCSIELSMKKCFITLRPEDQNFEDIF